VRVVGVDACPGGWAVIVLSAGRYECCAVHVRFSDILMAFASASVFAVDIPIGLPPPYPRAADREARVFVGPRWQSVFLTPPRELLEIEDYDEANAQARTVIGGGISRQAHGMRKRILELERLARADKRIIEVHPEVSFRELCGASLSSKHSWNGLMARREALLKAGIEIPDWLDAGVAGADDILDAACVAWSAHRYASGIREPLPASHRARIGAIWR
jgi:predicted RNase H-like nuclease